MQLFRGIREAVRDKTADKLYAHLLALGIEAEILQGHPLQKVSVKTSSWIGFPSSQSRSLGLVKVHGKNIGYVNCVRDVVGGGPAASQEDYLEYLVPLREIPLGMCWAKLKTRKRGLLRRRVVDIEWGGGTLADMLNGDPTLKESLLMEFQLNRPLDIIVAPEPLHQCARIETTLHLPYLDLPSGSLFDCLDRIAGHIPSHVTEVNSRPEKVLLEVKVEINPGSKDAEVADCYVTDRHLIIKSREPLQIPMYMIEDCDVSILFGAGMAEVSHSTVTLRYRDESGHRQKVEFGMQTYEAGSLRRTLSTSYPCGISR